MIILSLKNDSTSLSPSRLPLSGINDLFFFMTSFIEETRESFRKRVQSIELLVMQHGLLHHSVMPGVLLSGVTLDL